MSARVRCGTCPLKGINIQEDGGVHAAHEEPLRPLAGAGTYLLDETRKRATAGFIAAQLYHGAHQRFYDGRKGRGCRSGAALRSRQRHHAASV